MYANIEFYGLNASANSQYKGEFPRQCHRFKDMLAVSYSSLGMKEIQANILGWKLY